MLDSRSEEEKRLKEFKIDYEQLRQDKSNEMFMEIIKSEFERKDIKHSYIIDRFSMEARLRINKAPTTNKLPQCELDLLLGG